MLHSVKRVSTLSVELSYLGKGRVGSMVTLQSEGASAMLASPMGYADRKLQNWPPLVGKHCLLSQVSLRSSGYQMQQIVEESRVLLITLSNPK